MFYARLYYLGTKTFERSGVLNKKGKKIMTKKFGFTLAGATHVGTCKGSSKNAFTLAEVLITLGIIGVVAAMTMPTLINQTNGAQYKAAYKKALSAISQGVTLNVALDDKSFADDTAENILTKRMNVVKDTTTAPYTLTALNVTTLKADEKIPEDANKFLYFNDGSMFAFKSGNSACKESSKCSGFIDVNGDKGPNKVVTCSGTFTAKSGTTPASCTAVASPTDIYPVEYYDQTVLPTSAAGKAVLYQ